MKTYTCSNCGQRVNGQTPFVLHLLTEAGQQGVHTFELRRLFIGNPSERIAELEASGHTVRHDRERLHGDAIGARYTLITAHDGGRAVAGLEPSPPSPVGTVGGADEASHKTTAGPWRRVYLCRECGYRERPTRRCPRGHQTTRGWSADFTKAAA